MGVRHKRNLKVFIIIQLHLNLCMLEIDISQLACNRDEANTKEKSKSICMLLLL